jgi:D-methionine transport system permease protein
VILESFVSVWPDLQKAILETLLMVGITMVFAVLIGVPVGLLLFLTRPAGLTPRPVLNRVVAAVVNALRSFPFIILMVLLIPVARIVVGTSIGPRAAALALSVSAIPFFARLVEQNLREVPRGVVDAAIASGASVPQIIRHVLLVEARPGLLGSFTITTTGFIAYSAVAGAIGAGGLGDLAIRYGYYRFETDVMVWCVIAMFLLVQGTQWIGDALVRRLDRR